MITKFLGILSFLLILILYKTILSYPNNVLEYLYNNEILIKKDKINVIVLLLNGLFFIFYIFGLLIDNA
jgi:hypothetical protein